MAFTPPQRSGRTASGHDRADHPATVELAVAGMHCGACVAVIEESLGEQAGVIGASVDLESTRAIVDYDPSLVGLDALLATIAEAGYSATPVG
jgi:copper chaperone CopZ